MSKKEKEKVKFVKQDFSGILDPDHPCIMEFELPENTSETKLSFNTKKSIETNKIVKIVAANLEDLEQKILGKE